MMTLFEYIKISKNDYDTYDDKYDAVIMVCYIDEENDNYDKFCNGIIKKVNLIKKNKEILIVGWSNLIEKNMDKFKEFTSKYWNKKYEDDKEEFIYQWINEINMYMAGNVSEKFYSILNKFVETLD